MTHEKILFDILRDEAARCKLVDDGTENRKECIAQIQQIIVGNIVTLHHLRNMPPEERGEVIMEILDCIKAIKQRICYLLDNPSFQGMSIDLREAIQALEKDLT